MKNHNYILLLSVLAIFFGVNYTLASWTPPLATPPGRSAPPALNIGLVSQEKAGGITVNNLKVQQNGVFSRVGVGTASADKAGGISSSGDIRADQFCLGVFPAPEGCINRWQDGFGLSGGQAGALLRWLTISTLGYSAISESGNDINVGPKNINISGGVSLDTGVKLRSGWKISQLTGASTAGLLGRNVILSIDDSTGEVILTNADCSI